MKSKLSFALMGLWCGLLILGSVSSASARKKEKKDEENAEPKMTAADSINRSNRHLSFGARYLNSKQYEDAEIQLTKSWNYNQKNAKTAYYMGKLHNELEKFDEAISWFNKAAELAPQSKNTKNAYRFLAQLYLMQDNPKEAIQTYETLLGLSPTPEQNIHYLHSLVSLYVEEEDYDSALKYARIWGKLEPDNPEIQDTIAKLALHTGEEDEALEQMEKVLEMSPEDYATLETVANMYRQRDMDRKAFGAFEKLLAYDPQNYLYLELLLDLGRKLNKSKRFQIGICKKMLGLQPDNLMVIEQLADETGSLTYVNRGLKLDPGNGKLNYMKANFYYDRWKKDGSKQDSTRALNWYGKARRDPQWRGNAQRMIDEINPPLTEEQKKLQEFFNKKKKKEEEVDIKGKK